MANFANLPIYKQCRNPEKSLKPWQMGTHLRVLCESYPMNTNMTEFRDNSIGRVKQGSDSAHIGQLVICGIRKNSRISAIDHITKLVRSFWDAASWSIFGTQIFLMLYLTDSKHASWSLTCMYIFSLTNSKNTFSILRVSPKCWGHFDILQGFHFGDVFRGPRFS